MNTAAHAAALRLNLTRVGLRLVLLGDGAGMGDNQGRTSPMPAWAARLRALPGAGLLVEAVQGWWVRHPLHAAGAIAAVTADTMLGPVAQRHPLRLVLAAAAVGGLLVRSRPWRWAMVPALFAGLAPQLLSAALRAPQAGKAPSGPR